MVLRMDDWKKNLRYIKKNRINGSAWIQRLRLLRSKVNMDASVHLLGNDELIAPV